MSAKVISMGEFVGNYFSQKPMEWILQQLGKSEYSPALALDKETMVELDAKGNVLKVGGQKPAKVELVQVDPGEEEEVEEEPVVEDKGK